MRILLIGGNGQIGWELQKTLAPLGEVIAPCRNNFDLSRPEILREIVLNIRPDMIVNAGAYTAVDKAEQERDLAFAVNSKAPSVLAETCAQLGVLLVHYSTDYVFDGSGDTPFVEEDLVKPLNIYGASKATGEAAIRAACPKHLIFRTSWVYSQRGTNFFLTMRRLMREQKELRIVDDQIGAPTWARSIAEGTANALRQVICCDEISDISHLWGTYHMTSGGETSWFGFAKKILDTIVIEKNVKLIPCSSNEYKSSALRPLNSRLSNAKIKQVFGISLPCWDEMFSAYLKSTFAQVK